MTPSGQSYICASGGAPIEQPRTGRRRRTCSDRCRQAAARAGRRVTKRPTSDSSTNASGPCRRGYGRGKAPTVMCYGDQLVVDVRREPLLHVAEWVRAWAKTTDWRAMLEPIQLAECGVPVVQIRADALAELAMIDKTCYGYGPKRAIRPDRDDCVLCAELGRAIAAAGVEKGHQRWSIA